MALRFENSFVVKAGPQRVWDYLTDPTRVAPALPGAAITEKSDDGSYAGTITVKVGPVSARYRGSVRFEKLDPVARTAVMVARGQDVSGRGGADMRMESKLVEKAPGETEASLVSEVNVTGILAQFGRGLIQDVSDQMFQRFTQAVRSELERPGESVAGAAPAAAAAPVGVGAATVSGSAASAAGEPAPAAAFGAGATAPVPAGVAASPPIEVVSFGTRILARAGLRMLRRPAFWVVVAAAAAIAYWFSR